MTGPYDPLSAGPQSRPALAREWVPGAGIGELGLDSLPLSVADLPDVQGLIYGDGFQRMRHVVRATTLPTGLLPPKGFDEAGGSPSGPVSPYSGQGTLYQDFEADPIEQDAGSNTLIWQLSRDGTQNYPLFSAVIVNQLGITPQQYVWQIVQQDTDEETIQALVDALNNDSATAGVTWQPASLLIGVAGAVNERETAASSFITGTKINAHRDGRKLYIDWQDHELALSSSEPAGAPTNPLQIVSKITKAGTVIITPQVEGSTGTGMAAGGRPVVGIDLPNNPGPYTYGASIYIADGTTLPNDIMMEIVVTNGTGGWPAAGTRTKYYVDGSLLFPDVSMILQYLFNDFNEGVEWVGPDQAGSARRHTQFGFRQRGPNGGFIYYKTPGAAYNNLQLRQDVDTSVGAYPPVLAFQPFTGGTDPVTLGGVGGSLETGDYRYAPSWYRQIDKARSGIGQWALLDEHPGGDVKIADFPTAEDPGVDFMRLWRTLVDGLGDYFKVDDVPVTDTEYRDEKSDLEIAGGFGSLLYNPRDYRSREAGYPPKNRFLARHLASIWGGGLSRSAPQEGTATFTNGSDEIQIDGPWVPTRLWVGRYIRRKGTNEKYVIIDVEEAGALVTIASDYTGDTEANVDFVCEDERQAYATHRATTNFHNQWPARPFEGTDGVDADGITSYLARRQALYVWTRGGAWVITGSASGGFAVEPVSDSVGCVNQRVLVMNDNIAYWLEGAAGFYRWDFAGPPQRISNLPFQGSTEPQGIQGTVDRINWDAVDWAHAVADPDSRLIRWFVPVDGSEYPNYCITLDTKSMTWGEETCPPITSSCRVLLDDGWYIISGDVEGRIWLHDVGDSDGAYEIEPNQSIVSGDGESVTLASAPTVDLTGASVMLVDVTGEQLHLARVSAQAGASLYFREALPWTPQNGDIAVLGAIPQDFIPNRFDAGVKDEEKMVPVMWVHTREEVIGEYYLWVWDGETKTYTAPRFDSQVGDLTLDEQTERFRVNMRGHELGFRVMTYAPGFRPSFRRFELQFIVRGKAQQSL